MFRPLPPLIFVALASALQAGPLSPDQERATFQFADDSLTAELVAGEPSVLSPVAITWDARGRMFVAEMIDYPVGPGSGQVRMLEDVNHDGFYEKATVFADNLPFPNGVLPWKDGLFVTAAPNILFLRDSNGDGRADERRVILTGFAKENQQLRVNGLLWGLDGWVYGANGRSDGEILRPGETNSLSLRGHDFRFQPETGEYEVIAGRSQFGLARDDWGNRFLSWNTIAIRHEVIPEQFLLRNPNIPVTEAIHDLTPPGDKGEVFPLTAAPQTFNNESTRHFNALAGLTIYRGDALPARYKGNAFMGETLRNLVHRRVLEPDGPSFVARRVEQGKDFLASSDPWFHPVNFATGPDGALYVVDFYREWVEHPGYVPEKFRDKFPWRAGAEHGRIWRIRTRDWKRPRFSTPERNLVANLDHSNGWVRDTASRLLMERTDVSAVPRLKRLVRARNKPEATIHALHTLSKRGELDLELLAAALKNKHPRVRETALHLDADFTDALLEDADPAVRLWAILTLKGIYLSNLRDIAFRPDLDRITSTAIRSRAFENPAAVVTALTSQVRPSLTPGPLLELIHGLAFDIGRGTRVSDYGLLTGALIHTARNGPEEIPLALFSGFKQGHGGRISMADIETLLSLARAVALRPESSSPARSYALLTLAYLASSETSPTIIALLLEPHAAPPQVGVAKAIVDSADLALLEKALALWGRYQIPTRRQFVGGAVHSVEAASMLVTAVEQGTISAAELDASTRQSLLRLPSKELKARLEKLLGPPIAADRADVIKRFTAALPQKGDPTRGRAVYEKACAQCHSIAGQGGNVGPSLSGIASRTRETLLIDILDPSRQVNPEFISYTVSTNDGETVTGLLVSETPQSVTIRRPNVPDESIPRSRISRVQAGQISLMPDGLEAGVTPEDLADLLEFLSKPL